MESIFLSIFIIEDFQQNKIPSRIRSIDNRYQYIFVYLISISWELESCIENYCITRRFQYRYNFDDFRLPSIYVLCDDFAINLTDAINSFEWWSVYYNLRNFRFCKYGKNL